MFVSGTQKDLDEGVFRFGDHESRVRDDADALASMLRSRHNSPLILIDNVDGLVELRFKTHDHVQRVVKAPTITQALRTALEDA
jgi:hypothetical protein